jgi:cytochrome c553
MRQLLPLLASLGFVLAAHADGDPVAGAAKFETCRGCHAVPGYTNAFPQYHVPRLAGQHATRIAAALAAYRSGERGHPTMVAQASSLSDADVADIAAYLATAPGIPAAARASGPAPEAAQTCAACHGQDGVSPSPEFPILAGQHPDYLRFALQEYRSGARANPIMGAQAKNLSDDDIRALSAWFAAQPGPLGTVR